MDALEFSERLRGVLSDAREEATRLQHEHVGTEHLLLALLRDGERSEGRSPSPAIVVLDLLGVDRQKMKHVIEQTVLRGRAPTDREQVGYTSRAKAVLELAMAEARVLKHDHVSTEHLLLGLAREERGVAAQILLDQGVTTEKVRAEVAKVR
jgi:ATP-dependent Clp protease ATP-binding subunit ClpC